MKQHDEYKERVNQIKLNPKIPLKRFMKKREG